MKNLKWKSSEKHLKEKQRKNKTKYNLKNLLGEKEINNWMFFLKLSFYQCKHKI